MLREIYLLTTKNHSASSSLLIIYCIESFNETFHHEKEEGKVELDRHDAI